MKLKWILEKDIFPDNHQRLESAIKRYGHEVILWNDDWWGTDQIEKFKGEKVIFHGCLENAARISSETSWNPGAFCNADAFNCSKWYPSAKKWIVNSEWIQTTVEELVENPERIFTETGIKDQFFVRPNSPLKPFAGRVIKTDSLAYEALDHGFYYDDKSLEIIVSKVKKIENEWRYIIAGNMVVAGSGYIAETRTEIKADPKGSQWLFAQEIAENIDPPENVYVMDICLVEGELKLLKLNPFSGADLYGCDRDAIVKSILEGYL